MRIAVLTSSRADYGIYLPLLKAMQEDRFFDLRIIAFGTHLSSFHGYTIDAIIKDGFKIDHKVETVLASDTEQSVTASMALTVMKFSGIWEKEKNNYDLVFCLGDRYEMFAAVSSGVPFRIPFTHIHGGETTMGAIDNMFRHSISLFSKLHFVATESYAKKVKEVTGFPTDVYTVGALSLDNLNSITLLTPAQFFEKFKIDITKPSILVTYHPETIAIENNETSAKELVKALSLFTAYQIIITMPNADTMGSVMRKVYTECASENSNVILVESFGTQGYFSCMKYAKLVVGNSSSGVIEAASFEKYVVDIGDRQKGRAVSENVIHTLPDAVSIKEACDKALKKGSYQGTNVYYNGGAVQKIIEAVKKWKN